MRLFWIVVLVFGSGLGLAQRLEFGLTVPGITLGLRAPITEQVEFRGQIGGSFLPIIFGYLTLYGGSVDLLHTPSGYTAPASWYWGLGAYLDRFYSEVELFNRSISEVQIVAGELIFGHRWNFGTDGFALEFRPVYGLVSRQRTLNGEIVESSQDLEFTANLSLVWLFDLGGWFVPPSSQP